MSLIEALLLGLAQGATEFLPVSSSGHLVLFRHWLGLQNIDLLFDVAVHFATLLAIIFFFRREIIALKKHEMGMLVIGAVPAAVFGLMFRQQVELAFTSVAFVGLALMATGAMNLWLDRRLARPAAKTQDIDLTWKQALAVGSFQALAILPGLSRSGWTVAGAVWQQIPREQAFRFSFLLVIPVILGVSALKGLEIYGEGAWSIEPLSLLVGSVAAFISGLLALKVFRYVIVKARLKWFGWYCLTVGLLALVTQFG
jgi:undecaprenyl-diphosphatase